MIVNLKDLGLIIYSSSVAYHEILRLLQVRYILAQVTFLLYLSLLLYQQNGTNKSATTSVEEGMNSLAPLGKGKHSTEHKIESSAEMEEKSPSHFPLQPWTQSGASIITKAQRWLHLPMFQHRTHSSSFSYLQMLDIFWQ